MGFLIGKASKTERGPAWQPSRRGAGGAHTLAGTIITAGLCPDKIAPSHHAQRTKLRRREKKNKIKKILRVVRSSSYLWGCDRALTALPGQLCHGLLCAAPEVKHGESPHAKAAASRENEKEGGGEGGGKGTARSGSDGGATQRQSRRGDRTVPCPPKHQPSTEGRASARRLPRRAGPGSPAASAACTPPPRPRLIAPAPGRGTYWSPGQSGSPP